MRKRAIINSFTGVSKKYIVLEYVTSDYLYAGHKYDTTSMKKAYAMYKQAVEAKVHSDKRLAEVFAQQAEYTKQAFNKVGL